MMLATWHPDGHPLIQGILRQWFSEERQQGSFVTMPARVTLTTPLGQPFVFEDRTTALVGKEDDCLIRFPKDAQHQTISRHHCLFDINPPDLRIRDLRSRNGTYVNGKLIGKRAKGLTPEEVRELG